MILQQIKNYKNINQAIKAIKTQKIFIQSTNPRKFNFIQIIRKQKLSPIARQFYDNITNYKKK